MLEFLKPLPLIFRNIYYFIKPTLPVRYKHVLVGGDRALTGEIVY